MLNISVRASEQIFSESDPADCAYLVEEGWIEIYTDRAGWRQSLSLIGPGEIFGEMGVIDGSPRSATAVAAEDSRLLRITPGEFHALLGRTEPFLSELLTKLVVRFREAQRAWIEGTFLPRQESSAMGPGYTMLARHRDIAEALGRGQIVPYFQPIVDLATGRWRGFEALARWLSPQAGLLLPAEFLPLAERSGLIRRVDLAIAEQAMQVVAQHNGADAPSVNLNFSACHFRDDSLVPALERMLGNTSLAPHRVHIELTESLILDHPDRAFRIMTALSDMGLRLALDDFGTGYSSLSVLHRMPIHILKIDRTLVTGVLAAERQRNILRNVVSLAGDLGMEVVPEGIEDMEAAAALMSLGCQLGQGYLFAHPMPAAQAMAKWAMRTAA